MDMLEKAMNMLGPSAKDCSKPNKYLTGCIGRIKDVIAAAEKTEDATAKSCEALADKIEASLTGVDTHAQKMPGGVNPFVLASPTHEEETLCEKHTEPAAEEEAEAPILITEPSTKVDEPAEKDKPAAKAGECEKKKPASDGF